MGLGVGLGGGVRGGVRGGVKGWGQRWGWRLVALDRCTDRRDLEGDALQLREADLPDALEEGDGWGVAPEAHARDRAHQQVAERAALRGRVREEEPLGASVTAQVQLELACGVKER